MSETVKKTARYDTGASDIDLDTEYPLLRDIVADANNDPVRTDTAPKPIHIDASSTSAPFIGSCLDTHHPTLAGRVLVQWRMNGDLLQQWLPTLHGTSLRNGDRVLIQLPANSLAPIVIGVVDGFEPRPEGAPNGGPSMTLLRDESISIVTETGEPLVELRRDDTGPLVRLLTGDTAIEIPNKLRIAAESIELTARQGDAKIAARDNVIVAGEMIRLN